MWRLQRVYGGCPVDGVRRGLCSATVSTETDAYGCEHVRSSFVIAEIPAFRLG